MPQTLTLMEAQAAGYIKHIHGSDSNLGMTIEIENESGETIAITSQAGTVIGSKDPGTQKMVIVRERTWMVAPSSRESIAVDALCLEAHKSPPRSRAGEAAHNIEGMSQSEEINRFLNALQRVEAEISANITAEDSEAGTFRHTLENPRLVELAAAAAHVKGEGGYDSQVYDQIVQMPVWQLTDALKLNEYAKIVGLHKAESQRELRRNAEMLTKTATLAEILLNEAELASKQTIKPPEGELEVLYLEHDLLSSNISSLRREAIAPDADKESIAVELSKVTALLEEKEEQIRASLE